MTAHFDLPILHVKLPLFVLKVPKLELKPLTRHLKYMSLGEGETLSVIISNKLNQIEEEKLVRVLREQKKAVG